MTDQKIAYSGPTVKDFARLAPVIALWTCRAPGVCMCSKGATCPTPGKHPCSRVTGSTNLKRMGWNQTTDPDVIDGWVVMAGKLKHDLNWALCTGKALPAVFGEGEWLIVVDVDPRNGGDETLGRYEARYGKLPPTWTVLTGGGGQHYYYRVKLPEAPRSYEKMAGIEIKLDGGYVVIPPSLHTSGKRYEWDLGIAINPGTMAYAPGWVVDLITGTSTAPARKVTQGLSSADPLDTFIGHAMGEAGMRIGPHERNGIRFVECPWADEHSDGRGKGEDSSSVLLAPTVESPHFGGWRCQHAHCVGRGVRDLLTKLSLHTWLVAEERYPRQLTRQHRELLGLPPDDLLPDDLLTPADDAGTDDDDDLTADPPPFSPVSDNEDAALAAAPRPIIRIGSDRDRVCQELRSALGGAHLVFRQGKALVAISDNSLTVCKPGSIQALIGRVADIESYNERTRSWVRVPLSKEVCTTFLEDPFLDGIHSLKGLAHLPYVGPKGDLVTEPGFNADSGYFLLDSEDLRKVELPMELSQRSALAAMQVLRDVTCEIPFANDVHGYGWIALLLTMIARPTIDGCTPLFAFDASAPGSGKTLLVRTAALIAYGQEYLCSAGIVNQAEEMRKAITSMVAAGSPIMLLDNFTGTLRSPPLEAALTTTRWEDRILSTSTSISAPMQMIFAITGNNLRLGNDIPRRAFVCRLEPWTSIHEREGEFKNGEMDVFAKKHRFALYTAALTILAAHAAAGCPTAVVKPRPGFEEWSRKVASAIAWAGGPDVTPLFADDDDSEDPTDEEFARQVLVEMLERMYPEGAEFTSQALYERLWGEGNQRSQWPELVEALDTLREGRGGGPWTSQELGTVFGSFTKRPTAGRWLVKRVSNNRKWWKVTQTPPAKMTR